MHMQSKKLCAAGVPGQLLDNGAIRLKGYQTHILSLLSWCILKEQWQLELSCPGRELDFLCSLMNTILINLKAFYSVSSSITRGAGYGLTLYAIPDSC